MQVRPPVAVACIYFIIPGWVKINKLLKNIKDEKGQFLYSTFTHFSSKSCVEGTKRELFFPSNVAGSPPRREWISERERGGEIEREGGCIA